MNVMQSTIERLRPLVGMKGWDYCVLWKLRDDQRCIEWMGCCCGGSETTEKGEEHLFPVSPILPCRDMMFQHLRTNACDFLAELPSSMPLDSGFHTQALISSQPKWINISNISDSSISDETVRTRVLIPVAGGLVELFVAKHVHEDQHIIEFVMTQFNHSWEQEAMIVRNITDTIFHDQLLDREINGPHLTDGYPAENPIGHQPKPFSATGYDPKNTDHFQPWIPPATENLNLTWDLSADQIRLCNSPTNIFGGQPFPPSDSRHKNAIFFEGSTDSILSDKPPSFNAGTDHGFPEIVALQQSLRTTASNLHPSIPESSVSKELGHEKESIKQEMGRGDPISDCSDQVEDDDDHKTVGRSGRRHQSKNLVAERKRRKKLNDRLYALRSLVPKITKMDRAAILGDAIEFVKELQKQVKDLQDELEETPDEGRNQNGNKDNLQLEILNQNPISHGDGESSHGLRMEMADHGNRCSSSNKTGNPTKQNHDSLSIDDKTQQMEVQVEVSQVEGNGFFLKVLCEHKPGGFVRLMEAMNSLGLEVTNANVTTFRSLVLNVFKVEKRDNEVVQADQVRDSLLELTRNPNGGWSEPGNVSENSAPDHHHHQHHHHQHHHHPMNSHLHHLHHQP